MKTDIRLIALDLDGTLLDSQKRLSARNEKVLRECIARGIYVVPCTGRIWSGVPEFLRTLPGIQYAITTNGAIVEDVEKHKILDERKLSCAQAVEILELAEKFHTMYDAYVAGYAYGESRFLEHMDEYAIPDTIQTMIRQTRREVPDVIEKVRDTGLPVEKINYFFGDQQERARARRELQERGDVIVINDNYSRYKGKLQIILKDMPNDGRRNVVGRIPDNESMLLDYIQPWIPFAFMKKD